MARNTQVVLVKLNATVTIISCSTCSNRELLASQQLDWSSQDWDFFPITSHSLETQTIQLKLQDSYCHNLFVVLAAMPAPTGNVIQAFFTTFEECTDAVSFFFFLKYGDILNHALVHFSCILPRIS